MSAEPTEESPFTPGNTYQGMPVPAKPMTVTERASKALSKDEVETRIKELVAQSKPIVAVIDADSREVCHEALMVLRNMRTQTQRAAKDGRDEAVQYSKAVIAIEKGLVALIEPEETRLAKIRDEWDAIKEREKQDRINAEVARVAAIQARIDEIRQWPVVATGKTSNEVDQMVQTATDYEVTDTDFAERSDEAKSVLMASLAALQGIYQNRLTAEAKEIEVENERKELAQFRADAAERERVARENREKQEKADQAQKDADAAAQAAIDKANRERNENALQEIQAIHHQLIIADTGRAPYCKGGDLETIDWTIDGTEKWELTEERFGALYAAAVKTKETTLVALRQKRVDFLARQENEATAQRQADQATELAAREAALAESQKPKPEPKPEPVRTRTVERPTSAQLIALVAGHYSVTPAMAEKWLRNIKWEMAAA